MAQVVENCMTLDVNQLNNLDVFESSSTKVVAWSTPEQDTGASAGIRFEPRNDVLHVSYTITSQLAAPPRDVNFEVPIEHTECNFGGTRPWFHCPECDNRVGKLYKTDRDDRYLCRECGELIYRSQEYKTPMIDAVGRLEEAYDRLKDQGLTRETVRELYESKQATIEAYNDSMKRLDERFGDYRDYESAEEFSLEGLPPFDDWAEEWLWELLAPPGSERSYGRHGRCTAFAKTTGGRCRQPARGDSGKCYYHGGAPGSGIGEGQTNHARKEIQQLFRNDRADAAPGSSWQMYDPAAVKRVQEIAMGKAHL